MTTMYKFKINLNFNDMFHEFLSEIERDMYAIPVFDNEVFSIHNFCWCDGEDCGYCNGDLPNFHYKPDDIKIVWYKYALRDARSNVEIPFLKMLEIIQHCVKSYH